MNKDRNFFSTEVKKEYVDYFYNEINQKNLFENKDYKRFNLSEFKKFMKKS